MNEQTLKKTAGFANLQAELAAFFSIPLPQMNWRETVDRQAAE